MRGSWLKSLAVLGTLAMQSHAIFGIGGHWAPALGLEVKANRDTILSSGGQAALLNEKGTKGLGGFGAKFWIDALPFVDIELSGNMQFSYYDVDLVLPDGAGGSTVYPLKFDLDMPLLKAKPFFARAFGDAAILYPFLNIPPLVKLIKVYAGGGITYGVATQTLSSKFAKDALAKANYTGPITDQAAISKIVVDAITKEGLKSGMGGFLELGAKAKPPIVPIAAYLDFKYHFLGFSPDLVGGSGLTLELGGALAF